MKRRCDQNEVEATNKKRRRRNGVNTDVEGKEDDGVGRLVVIIWNISTENDMLRHVKIVIGKCGPAR